MADYTWLFVAFIVVVIVIAVLGVGWYIRNQGPPTPAPDTTYNAPLSWGTPSPGPDSTKNTCQVYTFPTGEVTVQGVPTILPGTPTFDTSVLNGLTGTTPLPTCLDLDQGVAQQLTHTCIQPVTAASSEAISRCTLVSGGTVGIGTSEVYFSNSNCPNIPPCAGQLAVLSLNFQAPLEPPYCLATHDTFSATMNECNPAAINQQLRVTRINPGQNPNSLQPGQGQSGLLAQFLDRTTGLCLTGGTGTSMTTFDPAYGNLCSESPRNITGTNVVLGPCTGPTGAFPGYVWALLPSVEWCPNVAGCTGTTGTLTTPPQVVYVGNIDLTTYPTDGYQGFTGTSAVIKWLEDNNAQSLFYGGAGEGVILTPFATDDSVCQARAFNAQYLNYTLFNLISAQEVCYAHTSGNCTPL